MERIWRGRGEVVQGMGRGSGLGLVSGQHEAHMGVQEGQGRPLLSSPLLGSCILLPRSQVAGSPRAVP